MSWRKWWKELKRWNVCGCRRKGTGARRIHQAIAVLEGVSRHLQDARTVAHGHLFRLLIEFHNRVAAAKTVRVIRLRENQAETRQVGKYQLPGGDRHAQRLQRAADNVLP